LVRVIGTGVRWWNCRRYLSRGDPSGSSDWVAVGIYREETPPGSSDAVADETTAPRDWMVSHLITTARGSLAVNVLIFFILKLA